MSNYAKKKGGYGRGAGGFPSKNPDRVKLGGLWARDSKNGGTYFQGGIMSPGDHPLIDSTKNLRNALEVLSQFDVVIYDNSKYKSADNQPDYTLHISRKKTEEEKAAFKASRGGFAKPSQPATSAPVADDSKNPWEE